MSGRCVSQGHIFINEANVTYSHDLSINGVFHEIDQILLPPHLDNPDVAVSHQWLTCSLVVC